MIFAQFRALRCSSLTADELVAAMALRFGSWPWWPGWMNRKSMPGKRLGVQDRGLAATLAGSPRQLPARRLGIRQLRYQPPGTARQVGGSGGDTQGSATRSAHGHWQSKDDRRPEVAVAAGARLPLRQLTNERTESHFFRAETTPVATRARAHVQ
jgi:hypothetical protein